MESPDAVKVFTPHRLNGIAWYCRLTFNTTAIVSCKHKRHAATDGEKTHTNAHMSTYPTFMTVYTN